MRSNTWRVLVVTLSQPRACSTQRYIQWHMRYLLQCQKWLASDIYQSKYGSIKCAHVLPLRVHMHSFGWLRYITNLLLITNCVTGLRLPTEALTFYSTLLASGNLVSTRLLTQRVQPTESANSPTTASLHSKWLCRQLCNIESHEPHSRHRLLPASLHDRHCVALSSTLRPSEQWIPWYTARSRNIISF
jgi:hypothetical protein